MKGNDEGNKSNVILLTVIALVTMIVVVIGATFAYLAGTVDTRNETVVNATTEADTDMLLYDAGQSMEVYADIENFGEGMGDQYDTSYASVTLQTDKPEGASYNYSVFLEVPTNDFEYTSGTCYEPGESSIPDILTKEDCTNNNATNLWATVDGTSYACYAATNTAPAYDNEVACIAKDRMWTTVENAELVMDIYRNDTTLTEEATCIAAGKCVDINRNILTDITSADDCTGTDTWLTNVYEEGICYSLDKAVDLTTVITTGEDVYTLYDTVTISSVDGYAKDYYKAVVTFVNFNHNQIANGNKTFNGNLVFETIKD